MPAKIYTSQRAVFNFLIFFLVCQFFSKNITAQSSEPFLSLTPVITTGLNSPIQFVNAGDGTNRVFIVQQGGTIRAYDADFNFLSVFATVSDVNFDGERGLLSMAFHPDYKNNGFFYVYYVNPLGQLVLARYHVSSDANVADPASKVVLISIPHPNASNHNGGELHFGNDGYLYLSTGDGGGAGDQPGNAQNTAVLLGKILRFNVNTSATAPYYTIPADNPFGNEVFDYGLRNPYRWSFDRLTHDMWIGDVGQDSHEEIDHRPADSTRGANFGWHCYEGDSTYNTTNCGPIATYVFPVYTYPSQNPSAAITGGIVYRGTAYPYLQGYNISADFYSGIFYKTISNGAGGWTTTTQTLTPTGIVDFGETENGEGYVISLTSGAVYRLGATVVLPVSLVTFNGILNSRGVSLGWQTSVEDNIGHFEIEYSIDGIAFNYLGAVPAKNAANGARYSYVHNINFEGAVFYRLKIVSADGSFKYSDIVRLVLHNQQLALINPSVISNGILNLNLPASGYNSLALISMNGTILLQKNISGQAGQVKVPVGKMITGVYMAKLAGSANTVIQKIFIQ